MNIALIINHFQPLVGYHEFFLCQEWVKMGHQVHVITSEYYFPFPAYSQTVKPILGERKQSVGFKKERGIPTYRLPAKWVEPGGTVLALNNLEDTIKTINPDFVLVNGVFVPLAGQVAKLKKKYGFSLVYDSHASAYNSHLHDTVLKRLYLLGYKTFFVPSIVKNADYFTAVGTSEKQLLIDELKVPEKNVTIIPLGADTQLFSPDSQARKKIRKILKVKDDQIIIVYAGKITPNKELNVLLKAFNSVFKNFQNSQLLIIGNGSPDYIEELKKIATALKIINSITWIGMQPHSKLAEYYNAADIGVWAGNLSNTIQEAMATGLPVILPKHVSSDQTTDHLAKNQAALQFQRSSELDLTKKLESLISDQSLRKNRGKNCLNLVKKNYSWEQIAKQYIQVYKKIETSS